ncbi:MAG: hypothetical protein M5R36_00400 [Deltaproteobacteria bacterium]|nr:hypothetical protein [Deltaproteobacteria bacterium]
MKYVDEFRRKEPAGAIAAMIRRAGGILRDAGRRVRIMEVCGSHTMAIARFGLRQFLPENVLLISGPGCPVCVTDPGYIDAAIALAARGAVISTFGDMLRVPGSTASLSDARAEGADVRVCYTPAHAIDLARDLPDRDVVFLAVGFETTAAPIVAMLDRAYRSGPRQPDAPCSAQAYSADPRRPGRRGRYRRGRVFVSRARFRHHRRAGV